MIAYGMRMLLAALMLLGLAANGFANGEIMIMNAFVQPPLVAGGKVGALYMTMMNHGAAGDRLIGISSPVAESVAIHESREEDGIAKMRPVEALDLAQGATVELKPGGYHAMLMGLKAPLQKGAKVSFTLTFETAGDVQMEAIVGDMATIHNHGDAPKQ